MQEPYSAATFETLVAEFGRSGGRNRTRPLHGKLASADQFAALEDLGADDAERGLDLLRKREVGVAILAGGMATRFGPTNKLAIEIKQDWPLLRVKLAALDKIARDANVGLPVAVIASAATDDAVRQILERYAMPHLETVVLRQNSLPRIYPDASIVLNEAGQPVLAPAGHGDTLEVLNSFIESNPTSPGTWHISNVDNVPATLDLRIVGAHARSGADGTIEIVRGTALDVGGIVVVGDRGVEIVESFELSEKPAGAYLFSTNTFLVSREMILGHARLPYRAARKLAPNAREVLQFERLLGDCGAIASLGAILVPREGLLSRFLPLKRFEDFERSRDFLAQMIPPLARDTP